MSEKSGHRDINGNWVDETPQAKLRNKLRPFWTLSCEESKDLILKLIAETEK
jgi:hypothetical protein